MEINTFNPELLKMCFHGGTKNPNESVNNLKGYHVLKKIFEQTDVLPLGTLDAMSSFNMGSVSKSEILRKLNIQHGIGNGAPRQTETVKG
ncbi:hypothetical protein TNCV_2339381 [Trichonephila clavipes]|nr:hypothetical protein TNCV_2339381 [Trichonephila clavipes]